MQQVETLLLQNEDTLEDDFLKFIDKFDYSTLKMFVMSDFIELFEKSKKLSLSDSDYRKVKYIFCKIVGDDNE